MRLFLRNLILILKYLLSLRNVQSKSQGLRHHLQRVAAGNLPHGEKWHATGEEGFRGQRAAVPRIQ